MGNNKMDALKFGTRKTPYTAKEVFDAICNRIKVVPEIIDYRGTSHATELIDTYEFSILTSLNFGGCEGIYLTLYAKTDTEEKYIGCFKTLRNSKDAMIEMGKLAGEFIYEMTNFVDENIDDFSWSGYEVYYNGAFRIEISKKERALERCATLSEKYDDVRLLDLATRCEINWEKERKKYA